jgi:hypothetical protein
MTRTDNQRNGPRRLPASFRITVKKPINATSLAELYSRVGLTPYKLTREDTATLFKMPQITWDTLAKKFRARCKVEWQQCGRIPGYRAAQFLFAHPLAQPGVPTVPGDPGLMLAPPRMDWAAQDYDCRDTFQVFSATPDDGKYFQYCGEYTIVGNVHVELKWADLPAMVKILYALRYISDFALECRSTWLRRFEIGNPYQTLRARIKLRKELRREPSAIDVRKFSQDKMNVNLRYSDVSAAFRTDEVCGYDYIAAEH